MALRKPAAPAAAPAPAPAATAPGGFEDMEGGVLTAEVVQPAPAVQAPPVADPAAAGVAATTAIAAAATKTTAVDAVRSGFKPAFSSYANVIPPEDIEAVGSGTFPRVVCDLGGANIDKKEEIGKSFDLELISWNYRYVITTGASTDNTEANSLVRFSYDGETISGTGESVKDYVKHLKEVEGYDKANVKTYVELWGNLASKNGVAVPESDRIMVQVQLSPQSVNQFKRFQLERGMKISRGFLKEDPMIKLTVEKKTIAPNTFAIFTFA